MKALNWIAWISGGIGVILVILGVIQFPFGKFLPGEHIVSYFHVANSFFLLTIALFIYLYRCECKK
jgi:hypothetical protein